MMRKAAWGCLLACFHMGIVYGQVRPDNQQLRAWQAFKAQHGQDWQMR